MIGSPRAYFDVIDTRSRGCPITGVRFELFVIGFPLDLHVNYARFNGFFRNVPHSFQHFAQKNLPIPKIPKFVVYSIN